MLSLPYAIRGVATQCSILFVLSCFPGLQRVMCLFCLLGISIGVMVGSLFRWPLVPNVRDLNLDQTLADWIPRRLPTRILRLLKDTLYAVYVPFDGSGIVQIMPDLQQAEYQQLSPSAQLLTTAWDAFSVLVKKVLIPLAENDVIHVDIRPGFEWTANLLFHPKDFKMLLIDADSLVLFEVWKELSKQVKGSKLITALPGSGKPKSALEFVLWQVIYVAETWMSQTRSHAASTRRIFVSHKTDRVTSLLAGRSSRSRSTIVAGLEQYSREIAGETPSAALSSGRLPEEADAAAAPAVTAEATQQSGTATRSKRRLPDT
jgi:hypothetical protein